MNHDETDLFASIKCAQCNETILRLDAFIVEKHTDDEDIEVPFCNESEANTFYLEKLRQSGL